MMRVVDILPHADNPADVITLDEFDRNRRRLRMVSDNGIEFLLDLPEARLLLNGDGLVLENGEVIEVRAKPEKLYEVRGRDRRHLMRLIWQIGNRHLACEIHEHAVRIREDVVIRDMIEQLGGRVEALKAVFNPERGAYRNHRH